MRILVVDDSEDSRDLTEGSLLSAGYTDIVTAGSGWEAVKVLDVGKSTKEKPAFDVVLLDIVMPDMDGVEACARIRNDARYADLPIIMVTSLDDMDSLNNAFVAGANDYVTKPINRVELIARVRAALKLKHELDRRQEREVELLSFLSNWGDRRAGLWIDEATGLFVGEVAEAYLTTACGCRSGEDISIVALMLDGFAAYSAANGDTAARGVLAEVARAVRRLAATVGIVAASYRNGMIILVAPESDLNAARELGEKLRTTIARLRLPNSESVVSDYITASVVAITGEVKRAVDRVHLLTQAISRVQDAVGAGGDRVLAMTM
ncbi:MAG TPA: response regulator [Xanthobacteraceae bacterium]|jgi:PleD family two-component response regulator|nr:response regulator [Xanthobacteraceae bacterium]